MSGGKAFFTVEKGGAKVDVLVLSRQEADRFYLLRDGSLVMTDAALLEDETGALRLETVNAENILSCFPEDRLLGQAQRLDSLGPWGRYRVQTEEKKISVRVEPAAPCRWRLRLPKDALAGLKDVRLRIFYRGDIGMLFVNDRMLSDNFCNGDVWEVGLSEIRDRLKGNLVLKISPIREGAHVSAETAMAARSEEVLSEIAELRDVQAQPVYEIRL